MTVLVGREQPLATLTGCLAGLGSPRCATLVAGPGLGKTALVAAFLDAVRQQDVVLLSCRPLETEASLGFAGLSELLAPLPVAAYDGLPGPQRSAILTALLLGADDRDQDADPRAVAAAVRNVVSGLADERPVVLVVDDGQWLDDASAAALGQALRRVADRPVLLVVAARPSRRPLTAWVPDWPLVDVALEPLPAAALFHVVHQHLGVRLDRGQLRSVEQSSGGNPLHALEFARHRVFGPGATFEALLGERLLRLPRPTRSALLLAALAEAPTVEVVAEARGVTVPALLDDLEPAVADGLVRLGEEVAFRHPLYLEAAVEAAPTEERAEAHRRLADAVPREEARVRHLARAGTGPDEPLADRLEGAAREAWRRGAWGTAIELLQLAVDRSADPVRRGGRQLATAEWLVTSGSPGPAETLLRELRSTAGGDTYWRATIELCCLLDEAGRRSEASRLARELDAADLPAELRAEVAIMTEIDELLGRSDAEALASLRRVNSELAARPDHPGLSRLRAAGLAREATWTIYAGGSPEPALALAIELDRREPVRRLLAGPRLTEAQYHLVADRHDLARAAYDELRRRAEETGDDVSLPIICAQFAHLEVRAGRWDHARALVEEGDQVAAATRSEVVRLLLGSSREVLRGLGGDLEGSVAGLRRLREPLDELGDPGQLAIWGTCLGRVLAAHGDLDGACAALDEAAAHAVEASLRDPGALALDAEHVEALVGTGRLDDAATRLEDAERRCRESGRTAVLAECARARLALEAAAGRVEDAAAGVEAMLASYDGPHKPLEKARAHLLGGQLLRRTGAKRRAHDELTAAREMFEVIGCPPFATRAAAELARVGLRPRASDTLTASERRIADLAATGLRNHEIAARAFVSPKTVEATLSRAYRKLGIERRAELARALDALDPDEPPQM
jgi:DNA-binding CsgD family transcriptional regulator